MNIFIRFLVYIATTLFGWFFFSVGLLSWVVTLMIFPLIWFLSKLFGHQPLLETQRESEKIHNYKKFSPDNEKILHPTLNRPFKIVIVGAGWAGITMAKHFRDRGAELHVFEQYSDVGGTWHPSWAYHGQRLHSAAWLCEFQGFPYPDEAKRTQRLTAKEVFEYSKQYCEYHNLYPQIRFNTAVTEVEYFTNFRLAVVHFTDKILNSSSVISDVDLVVFTQFASAANMPQWPGQELFQGKILHSSNLKTEIFDDILEKNSKTVVVGGSKSAFDVILAFFRRKSDHPIIQLSRSDYQFVRFNPMFHHKRLFDMIRIAFFVFSMVLALLTPRLASLFMHLIGFIVQPHGFHLNMHKFHFGVLDREDLQHLKNVEYRKAEIKEFKAKSIVLTNGQEIECDVVICGTGYKTGVDHVKLFCDDQSYHFNEKTPVFEGILLAGCPGVAFCANLPYSWGIVRAVSATDHLLYILSRNVSLQEIIREASKTHTVSGSKQMLFSEKENVIQKWLEV